MSNMNLCNLSDEVRNEILKAELISLLALLEKTFTKWWQEQGKKSRRQAYLTSSPVPYYNPEAEIENDLLKDLKKISLNLKIKESSENSLNAWKDFLYNWRRWRKVKLENNPEKFIQILYGGCEGINSGIEKGSPKAQIKGDAPFLTSSFGTFKNFINHEKLDDLRDLLFKSKASEKDKTKKIGKYLELDKEDFFNDRQKKFLEKNIIDLLRQIQNVKSLFDLSLTRNNLYCQTYLLYSHIPSDSRFPANDTSLFDQAYMATTLFKAALSGIILESEKDSESNAIEIVTSNFEPNNLKWSILGIQYDKLSLAEKGLKPGFIQWYRSTCERADQAIKQLLEIRYPLGNEVYRDETGIYFVVAENLIGETDGNFYTLSSDLQDLKQEILSIFSNTFGGEIYPAILLTKPSRGLMNLGYLIEKAEENFLKAERPYNFVEKLQAGITSGNAGICQVCRMRPADRKEGETLICEVCRERNEGRVHSWLAHPEEETIWTGELQDKNGRMALITLKFELDKWLNGDLLNTLINQNLFFPINDRCRNFKEIIQEIANSIVENKKINKTCLKDNLVNIPRKTTKELMEAWFLERSIGHSWEKFILQQLDDWDEKQKQSKKQKIDFDNRKIHWNRLTNPDVEFLSQLFLQFLLRKNPSPARLRRIWETTKEFLENINKDIPKILGYPEEGKQRLIWNNVNLPNGEYKDGDFDFWVENRKCYLITSIEKVKNKKTFRLKNYENKTDAGVELTIENSTSQNYLPILSIISPTPVSWQFAMPADRVPILLEKLKKIYNEHFKWVYGKLPLHVGIVVQHYKHPLYVGIQALRKIRHDHIAWNELRETATGLYLKAKQKTAFQFAHPAEVENGSEAFYSLYELPDEEGAYQFYLYSDNDGKRWLDTTQNHGDKDQFWFYPNTFDFEFLDTNARRNDIYYQKARRAAPLKANRPYWLDDFQYFQEFREFFNESSSISKLQKMISLIYSRLEDWEDDDSLKTFMVASFVNILDLKNETKRDAFAKILKFKDWKELEKCPAEKFRAKLKMLLDMFNFYHSMLKLLPEEER